MAERDDQVLRLADQGIDWSFLASHFGLDAVAGAYLRTSRPIPLESGRLIHLQAVAACATARKTAQSLLERGQAHRADGGRFEASQALRAQVDAEAQLRREEILRDRILARKRSRSALEPQYLDSASTSVREPVCRISSQSEDVEMPAFKRARTQSTIPFGSIPIQHSVSLGPPSGVTVEIEATDDREYERDCREVELLLLPRRSSAIAFATATASSVAVSASRGFTHSADLLQTTSASAGRGLLSALARAARQRH